MFYSNNIQEFALPLPITQTARQTAQQFASQQPTPEKAEQVRLNTLAVSVVNDYLQMMGISTELTASDSWNPILRLCADIADLKVTGVGSLECRPVKQDRSICHIPLDASLDRIGYVIVEIDESYRKAKVLGFTPTLATLEITIDRLQPLEDLIDRLEQLTSPVTDRINIVHLSQWLSNIFEPGWQAFETLLNSAEPNLVYSFRSDELSEKTDFERSDAAVRRVKLINLGMQLAGQTVALIVELRHESEQQMTNILLQLHPAGDRIYLPPLIQLIVMDESQTTVLQTQARSVDNYIQLEISGEPGEQFSVKVALGDVSITEYFVI